MYYNSVGGRGSCVYYNSVGGRGSCVYYNSVGGRGSCVFGLCTDSTGCHCLLPSHEMVAVCTQTTTEAETCPTKQEVSHTHSGIQR